jgi:hypothetical protein
MTTEKRLYAERDIMAQGQVYCDHVNAMTAEGLHGKSEIAAELAHRDTVIHHLRYLLTICSDEITDPDLLADIRRSLRETS